MKTIELGDDEFRSKHILLSVRAISSQQNLLMEALLHVVPKSAALDLLNRWNEVADQHNSLIAELLAELKERQ